MTKPHGPDGGPYRASGGGALRFAHEARNSSGRRATAAAVLAYESAGQVQAELQALDWITVEQKVTVAEPCDFDVYGWADGVLVCFEVRGGRLSCWSQRNCGAAAARCHLAATPADPAWADFARRTAELAALLAA